MDKHAFVGRLPELAALHARRRALGRRRGSISLIGGPAGIGKSRLVAEFCRGVDGGRAPTLIRTDCLEFGGQTFGPVREIVNRLVERGGTPLDAVAREALERGTFFRSLEHIVRAGCERSALVVSVEDVHWADAATLDFFAFLAPRIASDRIAIVLTFRDDEIATRPDAAGALARIARAATAYRIDLAPLGDAEMHELLTSAGAGGARASVARSIVARAAGNPFYAEELLKAALEERSVVALPATITSGVLKRYRAMRAVDRMILAHAAILGYRFDPELLRTLLDAEMDAVASALLDARARQLVVEEPGERLRFRFCHALTHETVAREMLELQARPLHARVVTMLAALPERAHYVDEIAYHAWKARDAAQAVPANEAAAEAALALHAYDAAAAFFERALSLAHADDVVVRLSRRAAEVATLLGDDAAAVESYERAFTLEVQGERYASAGEMLRRLVSRLVSAGRENEGRAKLAAFLERYEGHISEIDALLVAGWPMLIELGGGDVRAWRARFARSGASARATGRDAWALLLLEANAAAALGDAAAWRSAASRLEPYAASGPPAERANTSLTIAVTATYAGLDSDVATSALAAAHALCERYKLPALRKFAYTCGAFYEFLHGNLGTARSQAQLAYPSADDSNQRCNVAVAGALIGMEVGDAELTSLATEDLRVKILGRACSHSVALTGAGIAARLIAQGRPSDAVLVLESAVERLETLLGTQFILPLAALHVGSIAAHERIAALLHDIDAGDRSSTATRAMVDAVFAARNAADDRETLAHRAALLYRELRWPLLEAQALELAGDAAAAHAIYVRCGSVRAARPRRAALPAPVPVPAFVEVWPALFPRERDVAELVSAGYRNGEIAERLGLSVKTVEAHLSRIYARLGLRSRAQLATYLAGVGTSSRPSLG